MLKQLGQAYRLKNWKRFETTLIQANQLKISSGLKRVLRTFRKYQKPIHNCFVYTGLTNGPLEGINNKIKVLKRNAYGYRNYSHFRDRILLMTRLYEPESKKKIKQRYSSLDLSMILHQPYLTKSQFLC